MKKTHNFPAKIIYIVINIILKTIKFKDIISPKFNEKKNYIYVIWHEKLIAPSFYFKNANIKKALLVSASKDGEIFAYTMKKFGFEIIRGSSGKNGLQSILRVTKCLKNGYSIGTPIDGPTGPKHEVKEGLIYVAQKNKIDILPLGAHYSKKWILKKTWDQFQIPKPFSKCTVVFGDPINVNENDNIKDVKNLIKESIEAATIKAKKNQR